MNKMKSSLNKYKEKRNFSKIKEPEPKIKKSKSKPIFVVQKHNAANLHYDFRLEMNNVLKSWAIPKQPSLIKKRLAIPTEDHPLEYAKFHGTIPKGNYGAGKVEIFDKGTYEILTSKKAHLKFKLHGKKLKGIFSLIKTKIGWLLIKNKE